MNHIADYPKSKQKNIPLTQAQVHNDTIKGIVLMLFIALECYLYLTNGVIGVSLIAVLGALILGIIFSPTIWLIAVVGLPLLIYTLSTLGTKTLAPHIRNQHYLLFMILNILICSAIILTLIYALGSLLTFGASS